MAHPAQVNVASSSVSFGSSGKCQLISSFKVNKTQRKASGVAALLQDAQERTESPKRGFKNGDLTYYTLAL